MCGRARCTLSPAQIARAFGFPTTGAAGGRDGGGASGGDAGGGGGDAPTVPTLQMDRFRPSYNVSPGAYLPVGALRARTVDGDDGGRGGVGELEPIIQSMKWGLVPSFTSKTEKPDHFRMAAISRHGESAEMTMQLKKLEFNARSESIKEKASFRRLVPKNRCLVAVEGGHLEAIKQQMLLFSCNAWRKKFDLEIPPTVIDFQLLFYEWKKDGSKKQPYYIHFQDQRPLVFAALFDTWKNSEGETLHTFSILTTCASTSLKWLHDRMPVILGDKTSVNAWLNNGSVKLEEITVPYEGADLVWYPVTTAMGKTSFNGLECIQEVKMRPSEKPISEFFTKKAAVYCQGMKPEKTSREITETQVCRTAKEECDESEEKQLHNTDKQQPAENQEAACVVKDEPATLELQTFHNAQNIEKEAVTLPDDANQKEDLFRTKRKIEDTEVSAEMTTEKSCRSTIPLPVKKKEKGPKTSSDGQASLLSFFAKK